ncbi:MAG: multidrug RND transporter [Candidatus Aminicenantes bacterium]|nr:MAG: multidrug RND transporter [Candidatus Aminicenantes bacterium]
MREKILKSLARLHAQYPWRMLSVVVILTLVLGTVAISFLKMTTRWSDLLPAKDRRTIQFNKIINEFVTATSIIVVVQGKEESIKAFAEAAVPKIRATIDPKDNEPFVNRVDYKQEVDFIRNHGLMLIKADDLKNMKDVFKNPNLAPLLENINNSLEKEYVGREESLSTREKEDGAVLFLDGIQNLIGTMHQYMGGEAAVQSIPADAAQQAVDKLLIGEPYILSYEKTTLIINVIPNFTMLDTEKVVDGVDAVQEVIDALLQEHPGVEAGLTGMIPVGHDEMIYSEKSISYTTFIALVAVFFMLVISFRMWVAPVLAVLNLLLGIVWAMGVAAVLVGTLNIMTMMMAVILVGLGIDFSIHMISGFTEGRSLGKPIAVAMEEMFLKSGKGILTGGLTTSVAFLTLMISTSRGMKEMGIVTGAGLLTILIETFLFLPALLVLRERRFEKRREKGKLKREFVVKDISFKSLGNVGKFLSRHYVATIAAGLVVTVFLVYFATKIPFDQNYMNLEPKGLPSITLQDVVLEEFDLSMDYALILADSVDESRVMAEGAKDRASVAMTEDISLYFPSKEQQEKRIPLIEEIRAAVQAVEPGKVFGGKDFERFLEELGRVEMNIMEIQDMAFLGGQDKVDNKCAEIVGKADDPDARSIIQEFIEFLKGDQERALTELQGFQEAFAPYFKESVKRMSSLEPIEFESLPVTIVDRYANKDLTQFLVTIYPKGNIWQDAEFLNRFVVDLERVDEDVTGFPPVFRALVEIIGREGRNAALLTLVVVFLMLWLDYRKVGHALMAMIPLTIGVFWMLGLMTLFGIKLTVMNVMGLPMIIGIGVDDGVHIVHRWRTEGRGKIDKIFASTGKAIFLTSLTTMLAFGSLVFSIWRGFIGFGAAMFIGVGTLFLATVILLTGIIGLIERK